MRRILLERWIDSALLWLSLLEIPAMEKGGQLSLCRNPLLEPGMRASSVDIDAVVVISVVNLVFVTETMMDLLLAALIIQALCVLSVFDIP